jgi:hypothetical protein
MHNTESRKLFLLTIIEDARDGLRSGAAEAKGRGWMKIWVLGELGR